MDMAIRFSGIKQSVFADVKFDPDLGWDNIPSIGGMWHSCNGKPWYFSFDEYTSRKTPKGAGKDASISLYGGSFTLGAEVNDDQTWQYQLEQTSGEQVLNYGVGGFGADQSIFKLERNLKRGLKTPIIVLGVYSAAIPRLLSSYRPFYAPYGGLEFGFKPRLQEVDGGYDWVPSALNELSEKTDKNHLKIAFEKAADTDYFYESNKHKPRAGFPYSLSALRVMKYILFDYERLPDMWKPDHIAAKITEELIRRFVELSRSYEFAAVVVFMPHEGELEGYGSDEPEDSEVFDRLSKTYSKDELIMIDVLSEKMISSEFAIGVGCHPSEYGNKIIATAVQRELTEQMLLPISGIEK